MATHTLFPLSSERLLILTNRSWACDPHQPPLDLRPNPDYFRGAVFNFMEIQTRRELSEEDVLRLNSIIKRRAYRFVAAGREEWLYPERQVKVPWRSVGDNHLLMPDPRSLHPGAEIVMAYAGGAMETIDNFGRGPADPRFGHEARDAGGIGRHRQWCDEFEALIGPQRRGRTWEDTHHRRPD